MKDKEDNEVEFLAQGEYHKMSMTEFTGAIQIYDEAFSSNSRISGSSSFLRAIELH